jgi:hypothetical protein
MVGEIPAALVNDFRRGRVALFIGSGLSLNADLPGWIPLLNRLRDQFLPHGPESRHFNTLEPMQKAQLLCDAVGRRPVINEIASVLGGGVTPSELHSLLVSLPVETFITTNWDTLIESSYNVVHETTLTTIWKDDQISSYGQSPVLIKLHGTLQDRSSIIFSEEDYYRFSSSDSLLSLYVKIAVATSTLLFIGYGLRDFDFKLMNAYVRERVRPHYGSAFILLPNANDKEAEYLRKRGVTPIIYKRASKRKATIAFLKDLSGKVSVTTVDPVERLLILSRESSAVGSRAGGMMIRNHSNFGPLATPNDPNNRDLFESKRIGELEVKSAESWKELLHRGAKAKCMVCLNRSWILEYFRQRGPSIALRLKALRDNLHVYGSRVHVVDVGVPTNINIDIYGEEVCLESNKTGFQLRPYARLSVIRKDSEIIERIKDFERAFVEILNHNRRQAQEELKRAVSTNKYMIHKIECILNSMS